MSEIPDTVAVSADSVRVFVGYKQASVPIEKFWMELGETFMPGTPYMQQPLGLTAYVPTALGPDADSGLPDEVALIAYANLNVYQYARTHSLRRRMYTRSHAGVFDMGLVGGGGQFPGASDQPTTRDDRLCWRVFDGELDWQQGSTRLLFIAADEGQIIDREGLIATTVEAKGRLESEEIDQVIGVVTERYAAVWLHSAAERDLPADSFGLVPDGATLTRNLPATPVLMPNLIEGVQISKPATYNFQFARDWRFSV